MYKRSTSYSLNFLLTNILCSLVLAGVIPSIYANDLNYSHHLSSWTNISLPTDPAEQDQSLRKANRSKYSWHVYQDNGQILVKLLDNQLTQTNKPYPSFNPHTANFTHVSQVKQVSNGWLIGFNEGEWGGALYWFSPTGDAKQKLSSDQIIDFFEQSNEIYAIEGLNHITISKGSIVLIAPLSSSPYWQVKTKLELPAAPRTVSVSKTNDLFITLSSSLIKVDQHHKITTLLEEAPWDNLYPNSSVLSADQQTLYIGMRQFVGKFNIRTRKLKLLVPTRSFLTEIKLPNQQ